ncbi:hypothetical protein HDU96_003394, partial [Phlyctochytrium bullatum]
MVEGEFVARRQSRRLQSANEPYPAPRDPGQGADHSDSCRAVDVSDSPFVAGSDEQVPKIFAAAGDDGHDDDGSARTPSFSSVPDEAFNFIPREVADELAKSQPTMGFDHLSAGGSISASASSFGEVSTPSTGAAQSSMTSSGSDLTGTPVFGLSPNVSSASFSTPHQRPVGSGPTPTPPSTGSAVLSALSLASPTGLAVEAAVLRFVSSLALASPNVFAHCNELVKLNNAWRQASTSNFGPPGANNPLFEYRPGMVEKFWGPDGYVATVTGFPLCVALIARVVDTRGGVIRHGARYVQIPIDVNRGYGSYNERVAVCLQFCIEQEDMIRLVASVALGTRTTPTMREYDVSPESTHVSRTKCIRELIFLRSAGPPKGSTTEGILAVPPRPVDRLQEMRDAAPMLAEEVLDSYEIPAGPNGAAFHFQPVFDGRQVVTNANDFFRPSNR